MRAILEIQSLAGTGLRELLREMLVHLGEDPERNTPERMERSMRYLTNGYQENPEQTLRGAMFDVAYDEMVIVKDIEMFSLCEHHLLPFGKVHVAYIPRGKVIGLSKVPRLVDVFARRLQVQERLTTQIAETIERAINSLGVGVVIDARHLCMMMRGVEKQHSSTIASSMVDAFREKETRDECLALIQARRLAYCGPSVDILHLRWVELVEVTISSAIRTVTRKQTGLRYRQLHRESADGSWRKARRSLNWQRRQERFCHANHSHIPTGMQ